MLRLFLFGSLQIEVDSRVVPLRHTKPLALLAYLALTRQPQARDALLALLWPEFGEGSARNNLRRELSRLRSVLGAEVLVADRVRVGCSPDAPVWVDVAAFQEQIEVWRQHGHADGTLCATCADALATAAELYRNDFMAGFNLADCPAFDEWQFFQRELLRQQFAGVLQALIAWRRVAADYGDAISYARRWLALDPLHEPAHRELMRLYAETGQHAAALRQYDECVRLLDEVGVEVDAETTALYQDIRAKRIDAPRSPASQPGPDLRAPGAAKRAVGTRPAYELPSPPGFVGRKRELAEIIGRLTDRDCRLLTLTGPGGIGKTRLAIETAHIIARDWTGEDELADGVMFVAFVGVSTASGMFSAIAQAAGLDFSPNVPPRQQLLDFFRAKRMLLVLDNFEQLLGAESVPRAFVDELIIQAPGLRLLVTSRAALSLQEEWFHPVDGLSFPTVDDDTDDLDRLARFDAIRLFEQLARRIKSDFQLNPQRERVAVLCRLVEGMPLGIELAAAWFKVLSTDQVIAELQRGLAILTSRDRDIPERHRSIRAVMEQSWRLLSHEEQQMLAYLSVFVGFTAEAAQAVVGASLDMLAALVEKSFLRSAADGRLHMHELLRQFAAEQLAADPQLAHIAGEQHCSYFLGFLEGYEVPIVSEEQPSEPLKLAHDAENVQAAWLWAVKHEQLERVDQALYGCFTYYATRHAYQQGEELFSHALALVSSAHAHDHPLIQARVRAQALIRRGAFRYFLVDYEHAGEDLERGLEHADALGLHGESAYALLILGGIAGWRGDEVGARRRLEQALARGREIGNQHVVAHALVDLAWIASNGGDYVEAKRLAQEGLSIARAGGRIDLQARALHKLAWAVCSRGEFHASEAYYRESLALFERLGSLMGVVHAEGGVGWVTWCAGGARLPEAQACLEHSLAVVRRLGQRLYITNYLGDLGLVALDRGEYSQARRYADEGLALARELGSAQYSAYHLCNQAHVELLQHEFELSRRYLSEALRLAFTTRLWPNLAHALYHVALLWAHEANTYGLGHPLYADRLARALEMLASVARNPATWYVYRRRARRLIEELRHCVPDEVSQVALDRGQRLDWQARVEGLSEELMQLAPELT